MASTLAGIAGRRSLAQRLFGHGYAGRGSMGLWTRKERRPQGQGTGDCVFPVAKRFLEHAGFCTSERSWWHSPPALCWSGNEAQEEA